MGCATPTTLTARQQGEARRERALRLAIRGRLTDWACFALAPMGFEPAAHHRLLIDELEQVASGDNDRLMLLLPPGSAKSTYASLLFPAWWFARHPASSIIATSHTAALAQHFGRGVRTLIDEHGARLGYGVVDANRAAHRFATTRGGQYLAAGARQAVTGRRADLLLIDDPVRNQADADNAVARERLWDWYRSDLVTRLRPGGRVVLVMTRWHPDDLGGRLLGSDDTWRVVRLPALAEADDPLGRPPGTALWPTWEDEAAVLRKRAIVGERAFAALFQQSPRRMEGQLFTSSRIAILDEVPPGVPAGLVVRAWDLAATAQHGGSDPDWTVGLKLMRTEAGRYVVLDVARFRGAPAEVEDGIRRVAALDGLGVTIGLPRDPGQAGVHQVSYLTARLAGHRVRASPETGAKETRAMPIASQAEVGNLALLRGNWNAVFLDELSGFPNGGKDDQVDALSRAFAMLTDGGAPARFVRGPVLTR